MSDHLAAFSRISLLLVSNTIDVDVITAVHRSSHHRWCHHNRNDSNRNPLAYFTLISTRSANDERWPFSLSATLLNNFRHPLHQLLALSYRRHHARFLPRTNCLIPVRIMRDLVHVMPDAPDLGTDALKLSNDGPLFSVSPRLVDVAGLSGRLDEETRQRDASLFGQTGKFMRLVFVDSQRDDASPSRACLGLLPSRHASLPSPICQRQLAPTARTLCVFHASCTGLRHSGCCPCRRRRHGGKFGLCIQSV